MSETRTHFHVGIIVEDLEAARRRMTELFGLTWGPIQRYPATDNRDGDGNDVVLPSAICYSVGEPSIELIEEVPGSVWERNPFSNLHHIAFWTADLGAESAALTGAGCPLQLCGRYGDAAPSFFAYHQVPELGIRVEVLDQAIRSMMSPLFQPDPTQDRDGS